MSDVLSITVPIGGRYPSVNALRRDGVAWGRKTPEYQAIYSAVKERALAAMCFGWEKAACECAVSVTRFTPDHRVADAGNLGKCELDALTKAGVWDDDRLANPVTLAVRCDPKGEHRVVIVVVKLHAPAQKEVGAPKQRKSLPESNAGRTHECASGCSAEPHSGSLRRAVPSPAKSTAPVPAVEQRKALSAAPVFMPDAAAGGTTAASFPRAVEGWKPGKPIPAGYAVLAGKLVTLEYAKELMRK